MRWRSLLYVLKFSLQEMESKCYIEEEIGLFVVLPIALLSTWYKNGETEAQKVSTLWLFLQCPGKFLEHTRFLVSAESWMSNFWLRWEEPQGSSLGKMKTSFVSVISVLGIIHYSKTLPLQRSTSNVFSIINNQSYRESFRMEYTQIRTLFLFFLQNTF